jgi:hypothetical protein
MKTGGGKEETLDELKMKKMMRRKEKLVIGERSWSPHVWFW